MTFRNGQRGWTFGQIQAGILKIIKNTSESLISITGVIALIIIDIGSGTVASGNFLQHDIDTGFIVLTPIMFGFALQVVFSTVQLKLFQLIRRKQFPTTPVEWINLSLFAGIWFIDTLSDSTVIGISAYDMPPGMIFPDNPAPLFWFMWAGIIIISGLGEFMLPMFFRNPENITEEIELPSPTFRLPKRLADFLDRNDSSNQGVSASPMIGGAMRQPPSGPSLANPSLGGMQPPSGPSLANPSLGGMQTSKPNLTPQSIQSMEDPAKVAADKQRALERLQQTQRFVFGKFGQDPDDDDLDIDPDGDENP
ncbi:hypothetical protein KBC70_03280 [Candidatus Woesebacteria bacterium]|nr:hypothetical protein [Candidatus Woesebacteria bacterium]